MKSLVRMPSRKVALAALCSLAATLTPMTAPAQESPPRDKKLLVIEGSNTFGEELGPALIALYSRVHPDTEVRLGTEGTGAGMAALLDGACDIASASRVASEDELRSARARKLKLRAHFLGSYGVAVIAHANNPVRSLRDQQVLDIFTGAVSNWKQVGGPDAPIRVYIRDPVSGTHLGFQELAMKNRPYVESAVELKSYSEIMNAVKDDPHGIGYTGMTLVHRGEGLHALLINGIPPNAVSVNEGIYPYARGLRFYTLQGKTSDAAQSFIRFVRGPQGQQELEKEGYVPRVMTSMPQTGIAP